MIPFWIAVGYVAVVVEHGVPGLLGAAAHLGVLVLLLRWRR